MKKVNWNNLPHRLNKMLLSLLMALAITPAWAQEDEMKAFPGYVDFGQLNAIFGEPAIQISVGKSLLGLVGAFSGDDDDDTTDLFNRLHGVRVNVFSNPTISDDAINYVKEVSSALKSDGWESVVTVDQQDEQVRVFMKINGDMVEGITVMAVESDEAAFINVIGNLQPEELRRVMDDFDVDIGSDDDDSEEDHDNDA